jgi:hypothetical protein
VLYVRLLKNIAGSDGSIFCKGQCFWALIVSGMATFWYSRAGGSVKHKLVLARDWYEILICDPSHEGNTDFGVKFKEKNVKGGEN